MQNAGWQLTNSRSKTWMKVPRFVESYLHEEVDT
jgi:hypothetical protein